MIELTAEQARILDHPEELPLRVFNPQTQQTFVLLSLEEYQRLLDDEEYDDSPWTDEERDQLRAEACEILDSFGKDA